MRVVTIRTPEELHAFRVRLTDTRAVRTMVGAFLVSESQKAFSEQKLGEFEWLPRYPSQADPFVNFAAVLDRANEGIAPDANDFERRPALIGHSGDLSRRTAFTVSEPDTVTVGNNMEYASLHQFGGETSFPVNQVARDCLKHWCATTGRDHPAKHKVFLLSYLHNWSQSVIQRPFIGVTPQGAADIRDIVESYIGGAGSVAA